MHLQSFTVMFLKVICVKIPVMTQTLIYVHRNKQIQIWICAQALEFSHTHASKVHKIKHIFRTWPLQEYVQHLQATQKTHLTEHKHFPASGKVFLFHLLEKLLEIITWQGNQSLEVSITSQKPRKSSQLINVSVLTPNHLLNNAIKEFDGVTNSSALKTCLYHP